MKLSPAKIEQYRLIYRKRYNQDISYEEAERQGEALILHIKNLLLIKKKESHLLKTKKEVL
jgi:hypothetical protein